MKTNSRQTPPKLGRGRNALVASVLALVGFVALPLPTAGAREGAPLRSGQGTRARSAADSRFLKSPLAQGYAEIYQSSYPQDYSQNYPQSYSQGYGQGREEYSGQGYPQAYPQGGASGRSTKKSSRDETPSTVVTTAKDLVQRLDHKISLREAIAYADEGATITFDEILKGATITLDPKLGALVVDKSLTIDASNLAGSSNGVVVDGKWKTSLLRLNAGKTLSVKNVDFYRGFAKSANGGAIFSSGILTLDNCDLTACRAERGGGAIYSAGQLHLVGCRVLDNEAYGDGGGLCASGVQTQLSSCDFEGNVAGNGGAVYFAGNAKLNDCQIESNLAHIAGGGLYLASKREATLSSCAITKNMAGEEKSRPASLGGLRAEIGGKSPVDAPEDALDAYVDEGGSAKGAAGGVYVASGAKLETHNCQILGNDAARSEDVCLFVASDSRTTNGVAFAYNTESSFTGWTAGSGNKTSSGEALDPTFSPKPGRAPRRKSRTLPYIQEGEDGYSEEDAEEIELAEAWRKRYEAHRRETIGATARTSDASNDSSAAPRPRPEGGSDARRQGGRPAGAPSGTPPQGRPGGRFDGSQPPPRPNEGSNPGEGGRPQERRQPPREGNAPDGFRPENPDPPQVARADRAGEEVPSPAPETSAAETSLDAGEREPIVVTTTDDLLDALGEETSLRKALRDAKDGDAILFAPSMKGKTIRLNSKLGEFVVDKAVVIDALTSAPGLTLDGQGVSRVMTIQTDGEVELRGLAIVNGRAEENGGGICLAGGRAVATNCAIRKNEAEQLGGGVYLAPGAALETINCEISGNAASQAGGGFYVANDANAPEGSRTRLTLKNCTVAKNSSDFFGGGVCLQGGVLEIYNSILCQNTAKHSDADVRVGSQKGVVAEARNSLSSFSAWLKGAGNLTYAPSLPLFADLEADDFTLAEASQALDLGDADCVESEIDLADAPRVVGESVDLGAYEFQGSASEEAGE